MPDLEGVAKFMKAHQLTLVTAESCTAGLIAANLAGIEGAAEVLEAGFVVYSAIAKQTTLAVQAETIEKYGLTSEQVAIEMALGALSRSRANLSIANTGVADSPDATIPRGTQCFAWVFRAGKFDETNVVFSETQHFEGSRYQIRQTTAGYALEKIPFYFHKIKC